MPTSSPSVGRPRDPTLDRRIALAAVELFGRAGWAGFSVEAVARQAGAGKASIYLRWPTKERLLSDALETQVIDLTDADTGTLRGDLVHLARQLLDLYLGECRQAVLRMSVEASEIPGVASRWATLQESQILAARAMVRRAVRRGEVGADTSVTLLLDALCGGIVMHVAATPPHLRHRLLADAPRYAESLVDFLLRSVDAGS